MRKGTLSYLLLIVSAIVLLSCSTNSYRTSGNMLDWSRDEVDYARSAERYLALADKSSGRSKTEYRLEAVEAYIAGGFHADAKKHFAQISTTTMPVDLRSYHTALDARLKLAEDKSTEAVSILRRLPPKTTWMEAKRRYIHDTRIQAYNRSGNMLESARERMAMNHLLSGREYELNNQAIWNELAQVSTAYMKAIPLKPAPDEFSGWIRLSLLSQEFGDQGQSWNRALSHWKSQHPGHPAMNILSGRSFTAMEAGHDVKQIAVLLPLTGSHKDAARAIRDGLLTAYYSAKSRDPNAPSIRIIDSGTEGKVVAQYQEQVRRGADFVIGPLTKKGVTQLLQSGDLRVPVLALNTVDNNNTRQLIQFGLTPENDASEVAERARQEGFERALIVRPAGKWGARMQAAFAERWQQLGGRVSEVLEYKSGTSLSESMKKLLAVDESEGREKQLRKALKRDLNFSPRRRQDFDMVFLAAPPADARQVKPLMQYYYASNIAVYAPPSVYSGAASPNLDRDMNGVRFVDAPWVLEQQGRIRSLRQQVVAQWPKRYNRYPRLFGMGVDAYHLVNEIDRMLTFPDLGYPGATGNLSLNHNNQIYRHLSWAEFKNGEAKISSRR